MHNFSTLPYRTALFFGFAAISCSLHAEPLITGIEITDDQVVVTFEEDVPNVQQELQWNPDLDPNNWSTDTSAILQNMGGNIFTFTLDRSAADREFYRIIGTLIAGTELDRDGDGLANILEESFTANANSPLFSDPDKFDTDGDGFSDAVEYSYGTSPNDANSKPDQGALPQVQFAESVSSTTEGLASHSVSLSIAQNYSGPIFYSISTRSTASSPEDFGVVSGTTTASGGSATISIPITDNLAISDHERLIIIDLTKKPSGNAYRPAGRVTHVVCLGDNDSYWNGVLVDGLSERNFRLCIQQNQSIQQAAFVSGSSDGLLDADNGSSSQSTGVIPDTDLMGSPTEIFPASGVAFSNTLFSAQSPELLATTSGFLGTTELKRNIFLTSNPSMDAAHNITDSTILGKFIETVSHIADPNDPSPPTYLNNTVEGLFILTKDIPLSAETDSPFVTSP